VSEGLFLLNRRISCIFLTFWECLDKIGQFIGQFKMAEMLVNTGGLRLERNSDISFLVRSWEKVEN